MKPRFLADRLGIIGLVVGRERGVDYLKIKVDYLKVKECKLSQHR